MKNRAHNNKNSNTIEFRQTKPFKNLYLSNPFITTSPTSIIIGKNGSGKTRLFESIKDNSTIVSLNGTHLHAGTDISIYSQTELSPSFSTHFDSNSFTSTLQNHLISYHHYKPQLDQPYNKDIELITARPHGPGYTEIYKSSHAIAQALNKSASQLTDEEIKLHLQVKSIYGLGNVNVAEIFNRYVKQIQDNEYNEFRAHKGAAVPAYSHSEFEKIFGPPPWVTLNNILNSIFDGKFHFPEPGIDDLSQNHQTPLLDQSKQAIAANDLSSGEKTLLWLALSMFGSQQTNATAPNPSRLILLDEPDAYLHPKMVEKMYAIFSELFNNYGASTILITHSPTTAALAPDNGIFLLEESQINPISKDEAISQLLDGIPQVSLSTNNRHQVFVESHHDGEIYQALFDWMRSKTSHLNQNISLTFVSAGPKTPTIHIKQIIRKTLGINDDQKIDEACSLINGGGSCSQVYGIVDELTERGSKTIRGLVDWDKSNQPSAHVQVLAENLAYSIENLIFDPNSVLLLLHTTHPEKFSTEHFLSPATEWQDWINSQSNLQIGADYFTRLVLKRENRRNVQFSYLSGISIKLDSEYLTMNGHKLETLLYETIPELNKIAPKDKRGGLLKAITTKSMINLTRGKLVPKEFARVFLKLQGCSNA